MAITTRGSKIEFDRAIGEVKNDESLYIAQEKSAESGFDGYRLVHKDYDRKSDGLLFLTDGKNFRTWVNDPSEVELLVYEMFMRDNREIIRTPQISIPSKTIPVNKKGKIVSVFKAIFKVFPSLFRFLGVGK